MFKWDNCIAEVKRFDYVDGKTWNLYVSWSYKWYLTITEASKLLNPDMYWKSYNFSTEYWADIQRSDTIIIDEKQYSVQSVIHKKAISLSFTRAILIIDA